MLFCVSIELRVQKNTFLFILLFISVYWKYFECLVQIFAVHRFAGILSDIFVAHSHTSSFHRSPVQRKCLRKKHCLFSVVARVIC